jgi:hypothetical protein
MYTNVILHALLDAIPGSYEPLRSTCDGLPGDGGESTISGQSREVEGERPTEDLLYEGFGPKFEKAHETVEEVKRGRLPFYA